MAGADLGADLGELHRRGVEAFAEALDAAEKAGLGAEERDALALEHLRFDVQAALYRWTMLAGEPPREEEWEPRAAGEAGWPSLDDVDDAFGSWDRMLEETEVERSVLAEAWSSLRTQLAESREAETRARGAQRAAEKVAERERELRRRLETLEKKVDAERAGRQAAERAAAEAVRPVVAAPAPPPAPVAGADPRELDAARARADDAERALAAAQAFARELEARLVEEEDRRRAEDRARRPVLEAGEDETAAEEDPGDAWWGVRERLADLPEVGIMEEAVAVAVQRTPHLEWAERAFTSARESPFRDPQRILEDLVKLDRVAELYVRGAIGRPIKEIARELGLDWAEGATAAHHGQYGRHYRFRHAGREWLLEPHLRTSAGRGAGAMARTYFVLHPGDAEHPRGIVVGHIGRKLPDSTTR